MRKKEKLDKIPTEYLPNGWAETLALKHKVSFSTVQNIVYGLASSTDTNQIIWRELLEIAEAEKESALLNTEVLKSRVKALTA